MMLFQINLIYTAMRVLNHLVVEVLYGQDSEDGNVVVEKGTVLKIDLSL